MRKTTRPLTRDKAVSAELWLRSKHGTWRFFLVTASGLTGLTGLTGIDRDGKLFAAGVTVA